MHKDIKPENIVVSDDREAVLIDFGLSVKFDSSADVLNCKAGTFLYFAPELFGK